jgi:hypothetical protein
LIAPERSAAGGCGVESNERSSLWELDDELVVRQVA